MLKVVIEEEYGYRYWTWAYPGSEQELINDFKEGKIPLVCISFKGEIDQVEEKLEEDFYFNEFYNTSNPKMHIHDDDDSWLKVDDKIFYSYPNKAIEPLDYKPVILTLKGVPACCQKK